MPQFRVPQLRLHKASGQAVVTVRRRDIYCGRYGSPEADQAYRRVVASLVASGPETVRLQVRPAALGRPASDRAHGITVNELLLAFDDDAQQRFAPPSREIEAIRPVLKTLREL